MIKHTLLVCSLAFLLAGCVTGSRLDQIARIRPAEPAPGALSWSVRNRFRLIADQDQERFKKDLSAYIEEYYAWYRKEPGAGWFPSFLNSDLVHSSRLPIHGGDGNFRTHYDTRTTSYRCTSPGSPTCRDGGGDWITDPARSVELNFGAPKAAMCLWTVDGAAATERCEHFVIPVQLDHDVPVGVRRLDQPEAAPMTTTVRVRDLKIVALGDSFSAGEGNPHSQWRFFTLRPAEALWLDPRCHRSLMSAPSLAAAYIAQRNPYVSVTLLHYGCSGASIADGILTPWAYLETSLQVTERYTDPLSKLVGVREPYDQQTRPLVGQGPRDPQDPHRQPDYPPSQIEQALHDLATPHGPIKPDFVLLSVGGNDIGFASIVEALSSPPIALDIARPPAGTKTDPYLDTRAVTSFDEDMWVAAAHARACPEQIAHPSGALATNERLLDFNCMVSRVQERVGADDPPHATLMRQYKALAPALDTLTGHQPAHVFITDYPDFVRRSASERPTPNFDDRHSPIDLKGCDDRLFDGRPGLAPAIVAWIPGYGVKEAESKRVMDFLDPLNGAVRDAARAYGWNEVSAHVEHSHAHGFCSWARYFNTWADSIWNQGRVYPGARPLGNFVIEAKPEKPLKVAGGREVRVGDRIVWDRAEACFHLYIRADQPQEPGCVTDAEGKPPVRYDLARTADGNTVSEKATLLDTTGPVHPNLFGHCNYASAIVSKLVSAVVSQDPNDPRFNGDFLREVSGMPGGLVAVDICQAKTWGYELKTAAKP